MASAAWLKHKYRRGAIVSLGWGGGGFVYPIADSQEKCAHPDDQSKWYSFKRTDIASVKGAGLYIGDLVSFKAATATGGPASAGDAKEAGSDTKPEQAARKRATEIIVLPPRSLPFDCSDKVYLAVEHAEKQKRAARKKRAADKRRYKRELKRALQRGGEDAAKAILGRFGGRGLALPGSSSSGTFGRTRKDGGNKERQRGRGRRERHPSPSSVGSLGPAPATGHGALAAATVAGEAVASYLAQAASRVRQSDVIESFLGFIGEFEGGPGVESIRYSCPVDPGTDGSEEDQVDEFEVSLSACTAGAEGAGAGRKGDAGPALVPRLRAVGAAGAPHAEACALVPPPGEQVGEHSDAAASGAGARGEEGTAPPPSPSEAAALHDAAIQATEAALQGGASTPTGRGLAMTTVPVQLVRCDIALSDGMQLCGWGPSKAVAFALAAEKAYFVLYSLWSHGVYGGDDDEDGAEEDDDEDGAEEDDESGREAGSEDQGIRDGAASTGTAEESDGWEDVEEEEGGKEEDDRGKEEEEREEEEVEGGVDSESGADD